VNALLVVAVVVGFLAYIALLIWVVTRRIQLTFLLLASLRLVVGLVFCLGAGFALGLGHPAVGLGLGLGVAGLVWYGAAFLRWRFGKWSVLAKWYRANGPFTGQRWRLKSGVLGVPTARGMGHPLVAIQAWLVLGSDERGLFLSHHLIGRPFHPDLYIPWAAVTVKTPESIFSFFKKLYVDLHLGSDGVVLRLDRRFATRLLAAHGPAVPALTTAPARPSAQPRVARA